MASQSDDDLFFEQLAALSGLAGEAAPEELKPRLLHSLSSRQHEDEFFGVLAASGERDMSPASLKSRVYSRLVQAQNAEGRLLPLAEVKAAGRSLCVFEELVRIAPVGEALQSRNYCRVCHARVLAEHLDPAPIWWPGCPYVRFQRR